MKVSSTQLPAKQNAHGEIPPSTAERQKAGYLDPRIVAILTKRREHFLRYLQWRLSSRDEAEDLLQDFYIRVLTKADQIRNTDSAMAWLRTVLKSVLADHYRRRASQKRDRQLMVSDLIAMTAQNETGAIVEEDSFERSACTCFYKLLPSLKAEYVEILLKIDLAEQSRVDVAHDLGIAPGTVRVRLHRARRALRYALEVSCDACREHHCFQQSEIRPKTQ